MARSKHIDKRINYKKAFFLPYGRNSTFEDALRSAKERLPQATSRVQKIDLFTRVNSSTLEATSEGVLLRLSKYEEGAPVGTIQVRRKEKARVDTKPPPENAEYLKNESFVLVRENHILLLSDGLKDSSALYHMEWLIKEAEALPKDMALAFGTIVAQNKLKLIQKHKIREIDLDISSHLSAYEKIDYEYKSGSASIFDFLKEDKSFSELELLSRSCARLVFTQKGKLKASDQVQKWAERRAKTIIDNENSDANTNYKILLGNGDVITKNELVISKKTSIKKPNGPFGDNIVFQKLKEALLELRQEGMIHE